MTKCAFLLTLKGSIRNGGPAVTAAAAHFPYADARRFQGETCVEKFHQRRVTPLPAVLNTTDAGEGVAG